MATKGRRWWWMGALCLAPACATPTQQSEPTVRTSEGETTVEVMAEPTKPGGEGKTGASRTIADVGFSTPESVAYDADRDLYLVSNIQGTPTEHDDDGFISRVSPDGEVVALKWIDGGTEEVELDAPKGMALSGDTLYVADIDHVRMFDAETGAPKGSLAIEGASFLNDVAAGPDGTIYVSDSGLKPDFSPSGTDAIYAIRNGQAEPLIEGEALGQPNGLLAASDGLWVVTFGSGELYKVGYDGEKGEALSLPEGSLDGIVQTADGTILVSSWEGSSVLSGDARQFSTLVSDVASPADISLDTKRGRILIPLFNGDALQLVEIGEPADD